MIGAAAAAALALGLAACAPGVSPRPNVLILSVDTLNRSSLRAFDPAAPEHPALDGFARASVVFTRALSSAGWTLPAHASLLTGLYPDRHGATDRRVTLAASVPTLAEQLAGAGYETLAFTGGGFLAPAYGLGRGFERYDDRVAAGAAARPIPGLPRDGAREEVPGRALFDRALAFLEARPEDAPPFFLFLHTHSVHDYLNAREWAVEAPPEERGRLRERNRTCATGRQRCRDSAWRELRALYRAEVAHLDRGFARLLEALERRVGLDATLLVLLSDHGEGFEPERRRIHHGGRLHEDQIRIPLLVRAAGAPPRRVDAPVSLVDLAPTVLDWVGAAGGGSFDGRSLAPLLRGGPPPPPRPLYTMEHAVVWRWPGGRGGLEQVQALPVAVGVVRGSDWYIRSRDPSGAAEELYDMAADPRQRRDRAASGAGVADLRGLAEARMRERPATALLPDDPALRDQLRALGYLD